MRARNSMAAIAVCVCLWFTLKPPASAGTWMVMTNYAPTNASAMLLLSDGTVMVADYPNLTTSKGWYRLTPDSSGSYLNGTWSTLASMHDTRGAFSSVVLTNGRVLAFGGEFGTGATNSEVYDPLSNTWTVVPVAAGVITTNLNLSLVGQGQSGYAGFSDSCSVILPNGNVLAAPVDPATNGNTAIFNPTANTWSVGPALFRGSHQAEASWVKLPDDSILTIDPAGNSTERFIPSLNQWINDGNVPVALYGVWQEIGPALLLPDGRAFFIGGQPFTAGLGSPTAFYTPSGNTNAGSWQAGPVLPDGQVSGDTPGAMLVNGKILLATSPYSGTGSQTTPTSLYEFDPVANTFSRVTAPTNSLFQYVVPSQILMLDLPDGTVLMSDGSWQLEVYRPDGAPLAAGQPLVNAITKNADGSYHLSGLRLNGISQGAAFGDDAQMDSNYPLVRMTNLTSGAVYYARTYNWSSTSVMTSNRIVTTEFTLPAGLPEANYSLVAVANGNASAPVAFSTQVPPTIVQPPADQLVEIGGTATFSITAGGTAPLSYRWRRNSVPIAGATNSSYSTNNVQLADSGAQFSCVVSNAAGTTNSSAGTLTVQLVSVVTTVADSGIGSLRYASTVTTNGEYKYITFATNLSGATIHSSGTLSLSGNLTIDASALPGGITINGNQAGSVFFVTNGNVVLTALTITNGNASASGFGGGILNYAVLTLNQCTLAGNSAGYGGGIANAYGTLVANETTLTGNSGSYGG